MAVQLECCGVRDMSDYSEVTWNRRHAAAWAPLTCCSGLNSDDDQFPPTSFDTVDCVLFGNRTDSYHNYVRLRLSQFLYQVVPVRGSATDRSQSPAHESATVCLLRCER